MIAARQANSNVYDSKTFLLDRATGCGVYKNWIENTLLNYGKMFLVKY